MTPSGCCHLFVTPLVTVENCKVVWVNVVTADISDELMELLDSGSGNKIKINQENCLTCKHKAGCVKHIKL